MMYQIEINQAVTTDEKGYRNWRVIFKQEVESLDLWAVIQAVNKESPKIVKVKGIDVIQPPRHGLD